MHVSCVHREESGPVIGEGHLVTASRGRATARYIVRNRLTCIVMGRKLNANSYPMLSSGQQQRGAWVDVKSQGGRTSKHLPVTPQ
jgi:hypothetical protein